ncbi:hypothetical protein VTK26DRAFT_5204 [Humicola hyalothermophila]
MNIPEKSISHLELPLPAIKQFATTMSSWILFETTDSVIELLWDVALAFFVVRAALLYAALTFATTALAVAVLLVPHPSPPPPFSFLASWSDRVSPPAPAALLLLASSALWARYVVRRLEIPRVLTFRLAVGAVAALVIVLVEAIVGMVLYEAGAGAEGRAREAVRVVEGGAGSWKGEAGVLAAFAGMPALLMGLEGVAERKREGGGRV